MGEIMDNLVILDIKNNRLNFFENDAKKLIDNGFVKMRTKVDYFKIDDSEEVQVADVFFDLVLHSINNLQDKEEISDDEVDARISGNFRVTFESPDKLNDDHDKVLYEITDPYIRKEISDFCMSIGIPTLPLPYRFWEKLK